MLAANTYRRDENLHSIPKAGQPENCRAGVSHPAQQREVLAGLTSALPPLSQGLSSSGRFSPQVPFPGLSHWDLETRAAAASPSEKLTPSDLSPSIVTNPSESPPFPRWGRRSIPFSPK